MFVNGCKRGGPLKQQPLPRFTSGMDGSKDLGWGGSVNMYISSKISQNNQVGILNNYKHNFSVINKILGRFEFIYFF